MIQKSKADDEDLSSNEIRDREERARIMEDSPGNFKNIFSILYNYMLRENEVESDFREYVHYICTNPVDSRDIQILREILRITRDMLDNGEIKIHDLCSRARARILEDAAAMGVEIEQAKKSPRNSKSGKAKLRLT